MPIPTNITSEDIVKAIKELDSEANIPPSRDAIWYYIEYDGKIYPMKYVVSIANKFKNGTQLKPRDFDYRQAYNLLKKLEFKIFQYWIFQAVPKKWPDVIDVLSKNKIVSWWVKQHKKYVSQGHKVIIWIAGKNAGCYALGEVCSDTYQVVEEDQTNTKVDVKIEYNLVDRPILKSVTNANSVFNNWKVSQQGTIFNATKQQYEELLRLSTMSTNMKYWIYAPGENAIKWDECLEESSMVLGWDDLGDLSQYKDRSEISEKLKAHYGSKNPINNSLACYQFCNEVNVGDIIIAKQGRKLYLGYGIVKSDYIYDDSREEFKNLRRVNWIKTGEWEDPRPDFKISLKTLTDITKYPDYVNLLKDLLEIDTSNSSISSESKNRFPLNIILYGPPGTGKTYSTVNYALAVIENKSLEDIENESNQEGRSALIRKFNYYKDLDQIRFITFHQSYSYEDFIQGLRPQPDNASGSLSFELHDGIFKKIANMALRNYKAYIGDEKGSTKLPFEEVFEQVARPIMEGEKEEVEIKMARLTYHITDITDKSIHFRKHSGGTSHTLSIATLEEMYEKEDVGNIKGLRSYYKPLLNGLLELGKSTKVDLPKTDLKNFVIIIDEINRANISRVFGELITLIEADKRFGRDEELIITLPSGESFTVPPNLHIIGTMNTADKSIALLDIALRRRFDFIKIYPNLNLVIDDFKDLFVKLNEAIINERGPDFQIGHSYFMGNDTADLKIIFNNKVIPLLYEYFMNDGETVNKILLKIGVNTKLSMGLYEFESYAKE